MELLQLAYRQGTHETVMLHGVEMGVALHLDY